MKIYSIEENIKYLKELTFKTDKKIFLSIIKSANAQIQNIIELLNSIQKNLSMRFVKESLTYDRFDGTIARILEPVIFNYDYLNKIIDNFNDDEFKKLQSHKFYTNTIVKYRKLEIFEKSISNAEKVLEENELIAIELNKIIFEIEKQYDNPEKLDKTREQIEQLLSELKYYKNNK